MTISNSLQILVEQIRKRFMPFFLVFFAVIFFTYSFLYIVDFIPEAPAEVKIAPTTTAVTSNVVSVAEAKEIDEATLTRSALPHTIVIDKLDKSIPVLNPVSREIVDLDEALLDGVVRHPDSADFNTDGNMFILGHSSYLPNVLNGLFEALNGIQKLTWGDKIKLYSDDTEYVYQVERVFEAKATEVIVPHTPGEARLTLATCNSFGSVDDRFMVEAKLIETNPL